MSIADRMLARAKQVLEIGSEAADVLVHLQHSPSAIGLAAVGMRVVNSVREHRGQNPEEYFADWKPLELGALASQALIALRTDAGVRCREVPSMHDGTPALLTQIDGFEIGWAISGTLKRNANAQARKTWIPTDADPEPILQRIGQTLWTYISSPTGLIGVSPTRADGEDGATTLLADDKEEILPSAKGRELHERIALFRSKGLHRSLFILGEPGVGKSCLLRYVASLHGGFRLRLRLSQLEGLDPKKLIGIVKLLRPDVLVIDDFDRYVMSNSYDSKEHTPESTAMLDPLEVFNQLIPLVLVSANFSKSITKALLRPGRFSELITLDELDADLYAQLLPDAPEKIIAQLQRQKVPVAYIEELKKRVTALGYDAAVKEMISLVERSDHVLQLNARKIKVRKKRSKASVVGKSPAQKAILYDNRSSALDRRAARLSTQARHHRERAESHRQKAEAERKKVAATKTKKKTTKKKPK